MALLKQDSWQTFKSSSSFSMRSRVMSLYDLDPIPLTQREAPAAEIADYLAGKIINQQSRAGCCLLFPSLLTLARFFKVTGSDIRAAFSILQSKGYDTMIPGNDGHITLWTYTLSPLDK